MNARKLSSGMGWLVAGLVVVVAVAAITVMYQRQAITQEVESALLGELQTEAALLAGLIPPGSASLHGVNLVRERRVTLIARDGTVLADSQGDARTMDNHRTRPEIDQALARGTGTARRSSDTLRTVMLYAARVLPDGRVVRVAAPLVFEEEQVQRLALPVVVSTVLVLVVGGGLLLFQTARLRLRLAELVDVSQAFAAGEFQRRASLSGTDAIAALGHELNHLGERLHGTLDQLAGQRRLLDGALGALAEGVACIDRMDRVVYANPAWATLAGATGEIIGQPFYHHLPAAAVSDAVGAFRAGKPAPAEDQFHHQRRTLRSTVADGGAGVLVVVVHDLSEVKRLELARRDFLSAVSHELKTPLTAIIGFTDTLLDGVIEQDAVTARDFVGRIGRHADRLATLVRDVLTLSRLEQGTWEMRPEDADLSELLRGVAEEHESNAATRNVRLVCDSPGPLPVRLDAELLQQVVGNLVSNAIRYNRPGGTVWIRARPQSDGFTILVEDTGIGVPVEHRERIFERFYRVDAHRSRQTGGTGLGLAIVKHQVQLMGGEVAFAPGAVEGSVFSLTLPRVSPLPTA